MGGRHRADTASIGLLQHLPGAHESTRRLCKEQEVNDYKSLRDVPLLAASYGFLIIVLAICRARSSVSLDLHLVKRHN